MKKTIGILSLVLLTSASAFSYPITPRPLRKLISESEYIVQALVLDIGREKVTRNKKKKEGNIWQSDYALLLVHEQWQGKTVSDTIKVYYSGGMICPAPAHFVKGMEIIAFLDKLEDVSYGFGVHALSYGVKLFAENELEGIQVYKHRIREMQHILKMQESVEQDGQIVDWLVTCAENKYTRWEGTYELSPESDFMSYYDRDEPSKKFSYLSTDQKQRLFKALLESDPLTYNDLSLVDICTGMNDGKILELLKSRLESLKEDDYWTADFFMARIVYFTGDLELEKIMKKYSDEPLYENESPQKRKELLQEFIKRMKTAELKQVIFASGKMDT